MLRQTKAHQAAPAPVDPAAEPRQKPVHGPNPPGAAPEIPPEPQGPQNAGERPETPRLVPLDTGDADAGELICQLHAPTALSRPWGVDRYPAGTVFEFQLREPVEPGDVALARLSTGPHVVGTIEGDRFLLPLVGGQTVDFEIPEPRAAHVAPCLKIQVNTHALAALIGSDGDEPDPTD